MGDGPAPRPQPACRETSLGGGRSIRTAPTHLSVNGNRCGNGQPLTDLEAVER